VLVVEDEPLICIMAAEIFAGAGYRVHEARNAAEALAILKAHSDIGTVFTDIEMPGDLNGLGLVATISEHWPHLRVLVTSGRNVPDDCTLPIGVGFIGKPYHPEQVLSEFQTLRPLGR
jgi:CheY-like chemotaxis protein